MKSKRKFFDSLQPRLLISRMDSVLFPIGLTLTITKASQSRYSPVTERLFILPGLRILTSLDNCPRRFILTNFFSLLSKKVFSKKHNFSDVNIYFYFRFGRVSGL